MRSKSTNFLQGVVLFTGVAYLVIGLFFFISPYSSLKIFSVISEEKSTAVVQDLDGRGTKKIDVGRLTEEDWLHQINNDDIMSPLYYIFRIFSAFVLVSGLAMIMPLFDPLRYRGLIYFNGVTYPFIAAISLVIFILVQKSINVKIAGDLDIDQRLRESMARQETPVVLIILSVVFVLICISTAAGLIITRKQAKAGRE